MASSVEGIGQGLMGGTLRKSLLEKLEQMRVKMIDKYLSEFPDRQSRVVCSWKNRDKLSTAWLLSLPGPHMNFSNPEFREALSVVLCMPFPVCKDRIGEKVGSRRV